MQTYLGWSRGVWRKKLEISKVSYLTSFLDRTLFRAILTRSNDDVLVLTLTG